MRKGIVKLATLPVRSECRLPSVELLCGGKTKFTCCSAATFAVVFRMSTLSGNLLVTPLGPISRIWPVLSSPSGESTISNNIRASITTDSQPIRSVVLFAITGIVTENKEKLSLIE